MVLRCNGASFSGRLGSELRMLEERLKRGEMAPAEYEERRRILESYPLFY